MRNNKHKSPAKINRSILRLLNYKKDYLEDCWGIEIEINNEAKTIVWKASELLRLTLNQNIQIAKCLFNPTFPSLPFSEKLQKLQCLY